MNLIEWIDTRRPCWNLLITAGFHTAHTAAWELVGWAFFCALFLYTFKAAEPLLRWAFRRFDRGRCPYKPARSEEARGWTVAWKVADEVADTFGPWLVVLAFALL